MAAKAYAPGEPCWAELGTSDPAAAKAFYGSVFGWSAETDPRPEAGGYTMMQLGGEPVVAISPLYAPGQPTAWNVSFATDDADATAATARKAGGSVVIEPMDVFDAGRFAVLADPAGAVFQIWQPGAFRGAARFAEPDALGWVELATRDVEGAHRFYPELFGWSVAPSGQYTQWGLGGADFGGAADMGDRFPAEVPPHWMPYFAVADVDATAEKAAQAGASLTLPPSDVPDGPRIAVLRDPHGAAFGIHLQRAAH
ncbi:MAG TPA: VOC family protein [Actinocrinis sp.]|jgi:hypothetical protein